MDTIRILHVVPNMQQGGIENFIMNVYRNIDRKKIQFDFLVHYKDRNFFDDEIESMGGKIYRLSFMEDKNIFKYLNELDYFFKEHKEYKIVHAHMASLGCIYLKYAKKYNIPVIIAHSHGPSHLKTLKGYTKAILFKGFKKNANVLWACSDKAGEFLFGKNEKYDFIPNAIDFAKFKYCNEMRDNIRKELGIEDCIVFGNVGRFNLQKNHTFLISLFKKISDTYKNTKLILIGTGELKDKIISEIDKYNLNDKVILLGVKENVYDYYQAMDFLLMPSLYEGLPVTGVEAQVNGLYCIFADTITTQVQVTKNAIFIPLDEEMWLKRINKMIENKEYVRKDDVEILNFDFDIKLLSKKIEKMYFNFYMQN